MSETLEPALPDQLDAQAERLMRRLCDKTGFAGTVARGAVRVNWLKAMLDMLEEALAKE